MPKHGSMLLYVHRNHKAQQDGKPRTATSTLTQLLNYECNICCKSLLSTSIPPMTAMDRLREDWPAPSGKGQFDKLEVRQV